MDEFDKIAREAVEALPPFFLERLSNVIINAKYVPPPQFGGSANKSLLGIYEGIPLNKRGIYYSGAMPDRITLFKRNIELSSKSGKDLKAQIAHTVMHEIAHHFGITDEELVRKGLY